MKNYLTFVIGFGFISMSYTTSKLFENPNCPINYTGAPKATATIGQVRYCNNSGCHSDFALNNAGGSVEATGLPTVTYLPGQIYNFTIKITHSVADKTIWGFAVKAVNTVDNDVVGTFSTTNPNVSLKGTVVGKSAEISHANSATSAASSNFTYINLTWTAPLSPTVNQTNIRFYIVGVAGDNDGSEAGDYTYSTTINATLGALPVSLKAFNIKAVNGNAVNINWQTAQETNVSQFDVETSTNSNDWVKIATVKAAGNSTTLQSYAITDKNPSVFNSNIYYRLKIIDMDGGFKYSPVQAIKLQNTGILIENLSAQPLQFNKNGIFKIYSSSKNSIKITVSDMNGRLLYKANTALNTGTNTIEIPVTGIAGQRGIFIIKFAGNGFEKVFKQLVE